MSSIKLASASMTFRCLLIILAILSSAQAIHQRQRLRTVSSANSGTKTVATTSATDPDALFAYSTLVAEGGSVQELEREVKKEVFRKKVPKMTEQMSTVEYSSMIADKAEESDNIDDAAQQYVYTGQPPNVDDPQPEVQDQQQVQTNVEDTTNNEKQDQASQETKKWYQNSKSNQVKKLDMDKLNRDQKFDIQHQAISQAQDQLQQEQNEDVTVEESNKVQLIAQTSDDSGENQVVDPQQVQMALDASQDEVNTEGWDIDQKRKDGRGSKYKLDQASDSPFQVQETASDNPDDYFSKEEQEQKQSDEIVELYKKHDTQHTQIVTKNKKPSLFDELWERNNPEEAEELKNQEKIQKEREKQQKRQRELLAQKQKEEKIRNKSLEKQRKRREAKEKKLKEQENQQQSNNTEEASKQSEGKSEEKDPQTKQNDEATRKYNELVQDANQDNPYKEPMQNLVDQYEVLADEQNKTSNATQVKSKAQQPEKSETIQPPDYHFGNQNYSSKLSNVDKNQTNTTAAVNAPESQAQLNQTSNQTSNSTEKPSLLDQFISSATSVKPGMTEGPQQAQEQEQEEAPQQQSQEEAQQKQSQEEAPQQQSQEDGGQQTQEETKQVDAAPKNVSLMTQQLSQSANDSKLQSTSSGQEQSQQSSSQEQQQTSAEQEQQQQQQEQSPETQSITTSKHAELDVPSTVIDLVAEQQFQAAIGEGDKLKSHLEHLISIYNKNGGTAGLSNAESQEEDKSGQKDMITVNLEDPDRSQSQEAAANDQQSDDQTPQQITVNVETKIDENNGTLNQDQSYQNIEQQAKKEYYKQQLTEKLNIAAKQGKPQAAAANA